VPFCTPTSRAWTPSADLTAFVVDPLTAAPDELADAPIALTIVDGGVAHRPR
jgi:hypothetical protein